MNRNVHVRCGAGEKLEIISKTYLSLLDCLLWDLTAVNTVKHCQKGDIVSIRGRIQTRIEEVDGVKRQIQDIIGEKITFISSTQRKEAEEEQ